MGRGLGHSHINPAEGPGLDPATLEPVVSETSHPLVNKEAKYKVGTDETGHKEVIWWNTYVDHPTLADVLEAAREHFPGTPLEKIGVLSGIMSLTIKVGHFVRGEGVDKV